MTLVDTNLLIYSTFVGSPEHGPARSWLSAQLSQGAGGVVLCWPVIYAFVRLITSSKVFGEEALSVRHGWRVAGGYLDQPAARLVAPGVGHRAIAIELAQTPALRSDDVPDIELAALAIEHGLVLASHDRGFRRFSRLRFIDPLEAREEFHR
ncbi:MAG: TA system VapC family ribonuclease toxin [Chloroflexota bacterium]